MNVRTIQIFISLENIFMANKIYETKDDYDDKEMEQLDFTKVPTSFHVNYKSYNLWNQQELEELIRACEEGTLFKEHCAKDRNNSCRMLLMAIHDAIVSRSAVHVRKGWVERLHSFESSRNEKLDE